MKKNLTAAFTLIELLVVITIIAILASVALPAFIGVQERAQQTKDLSNSKQVGLALKQFATDNNGVFPAKQPAAGDYSAAPNPLAAGGVSNDAFWWLFPTYLTSEEIFVVPGSAWSPSADNQIDPAGSAARTNTLKAGENGYAYVCNLTDTSNAAFPLLADGFSATTAKTYETNKSVKGGVWAAKKAIVGFVDGSAQIMKVDQSTRQVLRTYNGATVNYFDPGTDWLDATANFVLNPQ